MKHNYVSERISIKSKPESINIRQANIKSSRVFIIKDKTYSNPFDSMISNGNSNPILPAVLNKHRKYPSISSFSNKENLVSRRPYSRSLNPVRSEFALPNIFKSHLVDTILSRPLQQSNQNIIMCGNSKGFATPCFSNSKLYIGEERKDCIKRTGILLRRDKKHGNDKCIQNLSEISFGDYSQNENIKPLFL